MLVYRTHSRSLADREIPEVREFIDNFPITPTITKETVLTGNEWVYHVTVSNTISIFGGHTVNGTPEAVLRSSNPQPP